MDLNNALANGNTDLWAQTVSKMFDVPRVIEEIKTSQTSKVTCLACKFVVNLGRSMIKSGKSDQEVLTCAGQICTALKIQTKRVCEGVMSLIGVRIFFYHYEYFKSSDENYKNNHW